MRRFCVIILKAEDCLKSIQKLHLNSIGRDAETDHRKVNRMHVQNPVIIIQCLKMRVALSAMVKRTQEKRVIIFPHSTFYLDCESIIYKKYKSNKRTILCKTNNYYIYTWTVQKVNKNNIKIRYTGYRQILSKGKLNNVKNGI